MAAGAQTGVTLRAERAQEAFRLGWRLFELVSPAAPERVRAISVDVGRWKLTATVEGSDGEKPTAVRHQGEAVRAAVDPPLIRFLCSHLPERPDDS